jgi:UDP-glucose 4-epimerase
MRICVTGGAGFIGSHVQDLLCAGGHQSLIIDDLSTGSLAFLASHADHGCYELEALNLCEPEAGELLVSFRPEAVIHLAAQPSVIRSVEHAVLDAESNIVGTVRMAEAARRAGTRKVVAAASGGTAYDDYEDPAVAVVSRLAREPVSPYGLSKRVMIEYLALYERLHGLNWTALAIANAYGPRQNPGNGIGVVSIFAAALLKGEPVTVYGDGSHSRDYVHVADIAAAFVAAVSRGKGLYNIGTGKSHTVLEVLALVTEAVGVSEPAIDWRPARLGEVTQVRLDTSTAAEIGWRASVEMRDGVQDTVRYMRSA